MDADQEPLPAETILLSSVTILLRSLDLDVWGRAKADVALTLALRLEDSEPREAAALAKQLTATLDELQARFGGDDDDGDWTRPSAAPGRDGSR